MSLYLDWIYGGALPTFDTVRCWTGLLQRSPALGAR